MSRLRKNRQRWSRVVGWAVPLLWSTDRRHCSLVAISSLTVAAIAPISVLVMAKIVGMVQETLVSDESQGTDPWPWILLAGSVALVGVLAAALRKYSKNRLNDSVSLRVRKSVLARASQLDLAALENREQQNELALLTRDSGGTLVRSVTESLNLVASALRVVCLAAIMFVIEPWGTLGVLAAALPLVAAGGLLSVARHRLRRRNAETQRWSKYYARHLTSYRLAPAVRVLGLAPWMIDQVSGRIAKLQQSQRRIDRVELGVRLVTSALAVLLLMFAVQRVASHAVDGTVKLGEFVAFWVAAWRLSRDATALANSLAAASKAWLETDYLHRFLRRTDARPDAPGRCPHPLRGEIVIDHVSFRYPRGHTNALTDISLRIEPGETIAIVGHNGAGKTTLAKLIAGLYRPNSGDIFYDGIPFGEIDFEQLHRRMALVMQRPLRLEASAAENIALGDLTRLWDEPQKIRQLSAEMGLDDMIDSLPDGYDTRLGRMFGDHDLSGGQWQKMAIARALACEPAIVVLDEPTSGLDVHAEAELLICMRHLTFRRTAIIVSHRFSTVAAADRIVVLQDGKIVEHGSHAQLISNAGIYAAMWRTQRTQAA